MLKLHARKMKMIHFFLHRYAERHVALKHTKHIRVCLGLCMHLLFARILPFYTIFITLEIMIQSFYRELPKEVTSAV